MGAVVYKVGKATGLTSGIITGVCVGIPVLPGPIKFLCQTTANYLSAPGDDGAPVFQITNGALSLVKLVGIHWWGAGGVAYISPIGGIEKERELGPLQVCLGGDC